MRKWIRAAYLSALVGMTASCFITQPAFAAATTVPKTTTAATTAAKTAATTAATIAAKTAATTVKPSAVSTSQAALTMTINAQTAQSLLSASAAMIEAARTVALDAVVPEEEQEVEKESEWYRASIPMKKEHQKLLWDYCKTRGLDYIDMLALISVESNFFEKCSSSRGTYRGYFQISKGNCANIAKTLGTKNDPMDGAISINWGTAMFSWILKDERVTKLPEEKRLDAALSIYQRGTVGYDKKGLSTSYLKIFYKKRAKVAALFAE